MSHRLAVDFGTTNTVVVRWNEADGTSQFISISGLSGYAPDRAEPIIPTLAYIQDGRVGQAVFGQAVRDQGLDRRHEYTGQAFFGQALRTESRDDSRLFRNFKRGIISGQSTEPRLIDGTPWNDQDAGRLFIRHLMNALPFPLAEIEQLVLTVPVVAFEGYVAWLGEAFKGLPPDVIRVVDESTAAALGYAVTEPGIPVLVFDFGGGSLDISLVELPQSRADMGGFLGGLLKGSTRKPVARVIAKSGLALGGSDIDQWLMQEIAGERLGLTLYQHEVDGLLSACEQAKIALSSVEETSISFVALDQEQQIPWTRLELEALLQKTGFYYQLRRAVEELMHVAHRSGIYSEDMRCVLMTGGTSLMPSVQRLLQSYFPGVPVRVDKPFTAIAEGALQVAAGYGLEDYLAHSYGLRYLDPKTGIQAYDEIIPQGSRYPTQRPVKITLEAAHAGQQAVEFVIGEIGAGAVASIEVKYDGGQALFVANAVRQSQDIVPLNTASNNLPVVQLDPPGQPGQERLEAIFAIDAQRRLRLTVIDIKTHKKLLHEHVILTLGEHALGADAETVGEQAGREPAIAPHHAHLGQQIVPLRSLATMLNVLPPESISLDAIAEALRSKDFNVRYNAAEILGRRNDRDSRLLMQDVLSGGTPPQRASIATHLYHLTWFGAEPLLRLALADPDERVREGAVYALCRMRGEEAYCFMREVLPGQSDNVKLAAAWGLSFNPDPESVPVLQIVFQTPGSETRTKAIEVLGATGSPEAIPTVRQAIDYPDPDVKYAAVLSYLELAREVSLADLAGLICASEGIERQAILRGFFHATNYLFIDIPHSSAASEVLDALALALQDSQPETRLAAARPLAWMRCSRAEELLAWAFGQESEPQTKANLLGIAVNLMSPICVKLLEDARQDAQPVVREMAAYLIRRGILGVNGASKKYQGQA